MILEEIKALAKSEGLEANLWEKAGMTRIYFNSYTGAGNRRSEGCLIINDDGSMDIDKKIYTSTMKKVWYAIPENEKFEK